jgi:CheY-like chemotaxis protein
METGKLEKVEPNVSPRAQKSEVKSRAKTCRAKRRKKESKLKVNLVLEGSEIASLIEQIKEEIEIHHGRASEVKAKLEKLTGTAFSELIKVKELKGIIVSLRENGGERTAASPGPPEKESSPAPAADPKDQWRAELDHELEKLLVIKKLLEASLPAAADREEPPALRSGPNGVKNILIVDDDLTTVKIISHFLQKENYRVRTSLSGLDGLKKAFLETPNLILLDVMMPDLDGFQFLSIFRKNKENAHIPVVILSSLSEEADVLKGLEIGAMDYITKPFSPQVLMAKMKTPRAKARGFSLLA